MQMNSQEKAGLVKDTAKGVGYLGIANVVANLIRILALALLARKLTAADFGIATLAMVFSRFGQESAAFGLETTIVQKKNLSEEETNNCFWGGLLFASALWGGYVVCSSLISGMMRMPDLAPALKLACIVIPVTCLGMVPRSLLERRLAYGKVAGLEVLGQGLGDISSVVLAFAGLGLWSIVAGFVLGETIKTIGFWVATRWRPNLRNMRIRNLPVWQFGSFVTADRILTYFALNVDRMIIGRVLGAAAAGYYALAFEMIAFPAKRFSALVGRVLFSSLSRTQDQLETAADIYLNTIRYVSILTVPAIAGLAVLAPEVSRIIYGPMADVVAPLIRFLCPAGIVFAILTPTGSLLYSQGRPGLSAKWSLLTLVVVFLAVSLGSIGGLYWTAFAVSAAWLCLFPVMFAIVARLVRQPWVTPYKSVANAVLASLCVAAAAMLVKHGVSSVLNVGIYFSILAQIAAGMFAFGVFLWMTERQLFQALLIKIHRKMPGHLDCTATPSGNA